MVILSFAITCHRHRNIAYATCHSGSSPTTTTAISSTKPGKTRNESDLNYEYVHSMIHSIKGGEQKSQIPPPPQPHTPYQHHPIETPPLYSPQQTTTSNQPPIPRRFLQAAKGNPTLAQKRYTETLTWRRQNRIDTILAEHQPHFSTIKRYYPHYFHLRGRRNEPVYYDFPGKMNISALKKAGVTTEALLRHYAFVTEFLWRVVEPSEEGSSIYVIDLEGLSVLDFVGDAVTFVRRAVRSTSLHYPERAGCVYVVNAPSWFGAIWSVVKPLLDEVTLKKIWVLRRGEDVFAALRVNIAEEMIPPEYG
eukprot:CAMPEP_0172505628 /NCGR_PEP_ID=MMETSP1066-20121228/187852_1 /TAXON_ID=671091 /ORGANISM="Coscinodiscus wailesii, Strain CCMP2513" /LENGTH=306 /DNA_ID=CAMNT_0013282315 /DNA_START=104 /DNA_END=1021 /DNA_ORIENTATION=-